MAARSVVAFLHHVLGPKDTQEMAADELSLSYHSERKSKHPHLKRLIHLTPGLPGTGLVGPVATRLILLGWHRLLIVWDPVRWHTIAVRIRRPWRRRIVGVRRHRARHRRRLPSRGRRWRYGRTCTDGAIAVDIEAERMSFGGIRRLSLWGRLLSNR